MLNQKLRQSLELHHWPSQLAVACSVGLLLGVACLRFPPLSTLIALAGLGVGVVAVKRPEIALLGILLATSSIMFENRLPLIPIGVGSLHVPDVLLLGSLGLIAVRALVEPGFKIVHTPLDWPLLAFCGFALLSTAMAIVRSSIDFGTGIRGFRVVSYYLTYFVVTNLVREERQLRFLVRGMLLLATAVAAAMVAQSLVGTSVTLLPGRVETLQTQGVAYTGVTRTIPPGESVILVAFITTTVALVLDRRIELLGGLQCGLLGMAVVLSFNRNQWVQAGLATLALAYLVRGRDRQRMVWLGLTVVLLATTILLPALDRPDSRLARLLAASLDRLATLGRGGTLAEESLQFRYVENGYAIRQIASDPLMGLGLGARYRPWDSAIDQGFLRTAEGDRRDRMHNGHLWVLMDTGLLGYAGLMWLSLAFLVRGFRYSRLVPDREMRAIALGFTLTYLGVPFAALVNPIFMQWSWTPVIGILMGVNEVIFRTSLDRGRL